MARSALFRQCIRLMTSSLHSPNSGIPQAPRPSRARLSRRRFIQLAGGTAIAARLLPRKPLVWAQSAENPPTIAIVGAGLAGLNAAYHLKKVGLASTVYEAKSSIGGRTQSVTGAVGEGLVVDTGGHFINKTHEDMLALADEFGLTLFDRVADAEQSPVSAVSYYFDSEPRSEAEVAAALGGIAQQIGTDAALIDEDYEQFAPAFDQLSVTDYLDRHADKISQPFARTLLEQAIRVEYGVEPEASTALQLLFSLPTVEDDEVAVITSDETYVVEGGISQVIENLAAALPGQIKTRQQLTRIESRGSGFRLTFNKTEQIEADYVILAIPFTVLRDVEIQAELPETLIQFINEVDLGANEKLFAGFDRKVWQQAGGFIQEMWADVDYGVVWDATQRQRDHTNGALTFFVSGENAIALQEGFTALQGRRFLNQSKEAIPGIDQATNQKFLRTAWTTNPFSRGAYTNFKPGQLTAFADFFYIESEDPEDRQDVRIDNLIFAGEHLSDEFYGYMNGGAQTGRLAAESIVSSQTSAA
ncbi:MAG: FAD-dependent oxidoreductase [Phormidesmis sp.]